MAVMDLRGLGVGGGTLAEKTHRINLGRRMKNPVALHW